MTYLGDFFPGATINHKFHTVNAALVPKTFVGVAAVYKDNSVTETVSGVVLTADFDGITGVHNVRIDTSVTPSFFTAGSDFQIVALGTVDGVLFQGVVGSFSINNRSLQNRIPAALVGGTRMDSVAQLSSVAFDAVSAPADLTTDADARSSFGGMFRAIFNRLYNEVTQTSTQQKVKNDAGVVVSTMSVADTNGVQSKSKSA
jgi:hypothetical protein